VSIINGLPAHALLVHLIVVLAPLTAALAILCAVWPAARQRLVWLVLALAVVITAVTPLTTEAGEWLEQRIGESPAIQTHAALGNTMLYFSIGLLIAAILLAVLHVRTMNTVVTAVIAVIVIAASAATIVQVVRIGDSGARATWSGVVANSPPAN
jgi:VanZ family protein